LEDGASGLRHWLRQFAAAVVSPLDPNTQEALLHGVEQRCRPALWRGDHLIADYRRLQIVAFA
jgi:hypothetical protein